MKERRAHRRVKEAADIGVTILSAPEQPGLENRTFTSAMRDMSPRGIRLHLPLVVPVGGTLEMRVEAGEPRGTLWHIGRVVWVRKEADADPACEVGVQFTESAETTLLLWEELLREKLSRLEPAGH